MNTAQKIGGVAILLAACQPTSETVQTTAATPSAAPPRAAWAETVPQYPILHDRTIEKDLWAFTHELVNTCGMSHDIIRIWAVRKGFSDGKTFPDVVLAPKRGRPRDEAYQAATLAYASCGKPIAKKYIR